MKPIEFDRDMQHSTK